VSAAAAAVLFRVISTHVKRHAKPLWLISNGTKRGYQLEAQVLAALEHFNKSVPSKLLNGKPGALLPLRSDYSLPFTKLAEVTLRDHHVLYRPLSDKYPCDGIIMPPVDEPNGRIYLVECSVTEPTVGNRVPKVGGWYKANGFVEEVQKAFPGRTVTAVLCYDGELKVRSNVSAAVVAMSEGKTPPPTATSAAPGAADASGAAVDSASVQTGAGTTSSHDNDSADESTQTVGDTICVLDGPILWQFLEVKAVNGDPPLAVSSDSN
jgi:hypothetical protein